MFKEFIDECIKIRKNKGMTQNEMAIYIGTSQQNVSKFEKGQNDSLKLYSYYKELEEVDDYE